MDAELRALLLEELDRRAAEVVHDSSAAAARRVAHALKGALGLAGERESSEAFARLERRLSSGEERAVGDVRDLVTRLNGLLRAGRQLPKSSWPEPPADLRSRASVVLTGEEYAASIKDRLARVDVAMQQSGGDVVAAALEVYREVHTMKGAALAVGDELMAWFCHGLEERLRGADDEYSARSALGVIERFRGVLSEIVDAPDHALVTLRLVTGGSTRPSRPPLTTPLPLPPRRPSIDLVPETDARSLTDEGTVRVSTAVLDGLFERAGQLRELQAPIAARATELGRAGASARSIQRDIREALRLIGPPRPWGAPAAALTLLSRGADELLPLAGAVDRSAQHLDGFAGRLSREKEALAAAVNSLRMSVASSLFDRVLLVAQAESRREEKPFDTVVHGGDTPIDRRLAEALLEPMRQILRNAVVHGLESKSVRAARGKAERGVLTISATLRAGVLAITVADDGAGVDLAHVRTLARERGLLPESGHAVEERALLSLLFYPGFSLRADTELFAGRGIGLDLTLAAVQRLGGTIQLESSYGQGLSVTVLVPAEGALVRVVWLRCGQTSFALPVHHAGRVLRVQDLSVAAPPSLGSLLRRTNDGAAARACELVLEVVPADGPLFLIGVEELGSIDEVALRALPPLVRATGPWAAGIIWADELRFSLDPARLALLCAREAELSSPARRG